MEEILNKKELDSLLESLSKAKDEKSIESYIYIKNILDSIEFPLPITIYLKGTKFVRSRAHKEDEDFFETVDQLSYRKDIRNIKKFGRANEPGQSIFYCANNAIVSFAETNSVVREDEKKDFEYITSGVWISTEDIIVVNLLTNENTKGQHVDFDQSIESFEDLIDSQNDENGFAVRDLLQFLSKEFSTSFRNNSNHYKITSAFTNYVLLIDKVDGILYPSTIYPTEGFNFALRTDVVDKKMKFYAAQRIKMQKIGDKEYKEVEKTESEISTSEDNIIK
ncbi:RES domain-containing protein [Flavobacterium psychroterrae]|uniref:RES domain-containing protein n=1 Tax=Flavobacterium psychroterrae TaxID=2133767 RepID=A0ABS5PGB9_9FLAO|nr:RES domain-containing protein [Flavobacterium psychroterrae]MBS7232746.1 RES domain-containing protein [Flavobacterium psychroterrae]